MDNIPSNLIDIRVVTINSKNVPEKILYNKDHLKTLGKLLPIRAFLDLAVLPITE